MSYQVKLNKQRTFSCMAFVAAAFLLTAPAVVLSQPASGTALSGSFSTQTGDAPYFRLIRLAHGTHNGTLVASESLVGNGITANIWQSTDNGGSWTQVTTVPVPSGSTELGGAELFEMPQTVGSLTAGTLLYAATYQVGSLRKIEIYDSTNAGSTWTNLGTPVVGGSNGSGIWEPNFEIASDGALVMLYSDETDPCCSQKLSQMRTYNGTTWQAPQNTVASPIQADRPGMAVVTKLPGGTYFMTYEDCGPAACTVYYRTSTDGWNWGDSSNMGTKLQTPSGQYFEHAPTNTWSPSVLSANGAILVVGQVFFESNGAVSSQNGEVILENLSSDGNSGVWIPITAPVRVPNAFDNYCPNYSSQLLPATDGKSLLELTSAYNSSGICGGYYASESWNNLPADASTHAFINMGSSGLCIDDYGWGTANNTEADLWTCTGSIIQQWTVHSKGSGFFSLANAQTGLCLDNTGGSQTPQNPTTLWGCANNSNQNWQFIDRGNAVYELMNQSSGTLVLDDWQASTTPGTQLEVFTANGSPAQRYILQDFATPAGPTGYIYCSAENSTCAFSGTAQVAYGANGAFDYGTFTNSASCSNGTFSPDPAPGVVKACYYLLNNASQFSGPGGYIYCASENQTCSFAAAGVVAFGANGLFNYQTFTGGAPCNTATFGDPDSGVVKACYYRAIP